jgi:hypothetical protein
VADILAKLITNAHNTFGERATEFLNEGEKVPKAMRHALQRKLIEDPSILPAAAPGFVSAAKRLPSRIGLFRRTGVF